MANITIKPGDTLSGIAKARGTTTQDLLKANPSITNPDLIQAGASLTLPDSRPAAEKTSPNIDIPEETPVSNEVTPTPPRGELELPEPTARETQQRSVESLTGRTERLRQQIDTSFARQLEGSTTQLNELRDERKRLLEQDIKPLTDPFRQELREAERERLHINENFEANQRLVGELEGLLTEGNALVEQMKGVTGLAGIRNPRINQAINAVNARAGVIESVISARNGQIAQAQTMIENSIASIQADREDQLSYYNAILKMVDRDIVQVEKDVKDLVSERRGMLEKELESAQATADYIKELMVTPESAQIMADAGVTLEDSIEEINTKVANAQANEEVVNFKNQMTLDGFEFVPFPEGQTGLKRFTVGGKELAFKPPEEGPMSISDRKDLIELAKEGDPEAIRRLGYDPNDKELDSEAIVANEEQMEVVTRDIDRLDDLIDNDAAIRASAGSFTLALPTAITPGTGTFDGGTEMLGWSDAWNNKKDFLNEVSYIVNNLSFDKIIDLKKSGVTFGSLTDSERMAIGKAADPIAAMAVVDESGNVTGINGSEEALRTALKNLRRELYKSQDRLNVELMSKNERDEVAEVYNES